MVAKNWVNIGSGNDLFPDGTKPIIRTNVDLWLLSCCGIHLSAISWEILKISIFDIVWKITNLTLQLHLQENKELI